jgi:hypothetical protein
MSWDMGFGSRNRNTHGQTLFTWLINLTFKIGQEGESILFLEDLNKRMIDLENKLVQNFLQNKNLGCYLSEATYIGGRGAWEEKRNMIWFWC